MSMKGTLSQRFAGIPAWGWVALIGAGGGVVWVARRRATTKPPADSSLGIDAYGPLPRGVGDAGGGGEGYGGGDSDSTTLQQILDAINKLKPTTTTPTQPRTATPRPTTKPIANILAPHDISGQLDLSKLGTVVGQSTVTNPVSSLQKTAYYTPSALDIASTLPGGLSSSLFVPTGKSISQGQYSDVFTNFTGGSGNPVAPSNFITGERYDAYGRVIL